MIRALVLAMAVILGGASGAALAGFDLSEMFGPAVPNDQAEEQLRGASAPGSGASAISLYTTALLRDPSSPNRWTRLGNAYVAQGDSGRAAACFARALQLGPQIPAVLMRVAQFDFVHALTAEGFAAASRLLSLDDSFDERVFKMYDVQQLPPAKVFVDGIPSERAAHSYFEHLRKTSSPADMEAGWQLLAAKRWTNPRLARGYIQTNLETGNFVAAARASSAYLSQLDPRFLSPSLVFDGGFEVPPEGLPLEWTIFPFEGMAVERDPTAAHSGRISLHLRFADAGNALFGHVLQRLYPRPGRWSARAFIRTVALSSNEGVRLLISDSDSPARLYVQTPAVVGTHDWTKVEATFRVTSATHELKLQIFRPQDHSKGSSSESTIAGDAWIDDISVEPELAVPGFPRR